MADKSILILGAGISGMASGWLLQQAGYRVNFIAKAFSPDITSNKAAAFWFPYHIRNDKRGISWCQQSYAMYRHLSADNTTGISFVTLQKVLRNEVVEEEPEWISFMPEGCFKVLGENKIPGFRKVYEVTVPLIETQQFLPWLQSRLESNGARFTQNEIFSMDTYTQQYDLVINCTGLGSKELCKDDTLVPVRGQVGLLEPGITMPIYLDNEKPIYVVPRKDAIIVGGTYEEGIATAVTEPATIQQLIHNAMEALPILQTQAIKGSWAGIRPYRATVRVETEAGKNIVHNYGHGGSGFTLAFGCAQTVVQLVQQYFNN